MNTGVLRCNLFLLSILLTSLVSVQNEMRANLTAGKVVFLAAVVVPVSLAYIRLRTKDRNPNPMELKAGIDGFYSEDIREGKPLSEYTWNFIDDVIIGHEGTSARIKPMSSSITVTGDKERVYSRDYSDDERLELFLYASKPAYGFMGVLISEYISPVASGVKEIQNWAKAWNFISPIFE